MIIHSSKVGDFYHYEDRNSYVYLGQLKYIFKGLQLDRYSKYSPFYFTKDSIKSDLRTWISYLHLLHNTFPMKHDYGDILHMSLNVDYEVLLQSPEFLEAFYNVLEEYILHMCKNPFYGRII
jgi:hypothetical protein